MSWTFSFFSFFLLLFLPVYIGVFLAHFHKRFFVRSVLGDKLSVVEQAFWKLATRTLHRKRTSKERHHLWWVEPFFFLFFFAGLCWSIFCTLSHMFSVRSVLGDKASVVEQVPSFLKIGHQHTAQEEDQSTKASCLVSWAFCCCCFWSSFF